MPTSTWAFSISFSFSNIGLICYLDFGILIICTDFFFQMLSVHFWRSQSCEVNDHLAWNHFNFGLLIQIRITFPNIPPLVDVTWLSEAYYIPLECLNLPVDETENAWGLAYCSLKNFGHGERQWFSEF